MGERQEAVLYGITNEEPEPVTAQRAGLPLELEWIIGKTLAKDREERYQHAEDLLVDLRGLQKKLASGKSTILKAQAGTQTAATQPAQTGQGSPGPLARYRKNIERVQQRKQAMLLGIAALGVLFGLAFASLWLFSPDSVAETPVRRFSFSPEGLTGGGISPDGKYVLYWVETGARRNGRPGTSSR